MYAFVTYISQQLQEIDALAKGTLTRTNERLLFFCTTRGNAV